VTAAGAEAPTGHRSPPMPLPERVHQLRNEHGWSQAQLAEAVELHAAQIRRYEAGTAQPTLDVIRRLARALNVSADLLIFDTDERGPSEDLALVFEATSQLDDEGRALVKALVEGIVLRQQSRRFANAS
jgi:transcriptional regulator with XRE-family HTH domain